MPDVEYTASKGEERDANPLTGQDISIVSIEEYDRVKEELASSDRAYGRMVGAHNILQSKLRYHRDMTRQWREYTKRWISKDATKRAKSVKSTVPKPTSGVTGQGQSASDAPNPPAFPKGITPSVSDISRSTSPQQQGSTGSNDLQRGNTAPAGQERTMEALRNDIIATQSALNHGHEADAGDSTESFDDSDWIPHSADHSKTPRSIASDHKEVTVPSLAERNGGSSPVVVLERSLKRKRPIRGNEEDIHVHEDGASRTDGAVKPKTVKNEQPSSSPVPALPSLPVASVHDSLDLDDVGDHLDTPRKRQQMERLRMRSSMLAPPAGSSEDPGMLDDALDYAVGPEHENGLLGVKVVDDDQLITKDHKTRSKADENHQRARETEQERLARKYAKRAQFQAHNDRVVGRLEAEQQDPDDGALPIAGRNKSPCAKAYPTPATEGPNRFGTPKGCRETKQRKAKLASPVLRPTDPNSHILPRTSEDSAHYKRPVPPSRRDRGAAHVPALAEDGDGPGATSNSRAAPRDKPNSKQIDTEAPGNIFAKAPDMHLRLGTLLTEPSPAKSVSGSKELDLTSLFPSFRTPHARSGQNDRFKAPTTSPSMPARRSKPSGDTDRTRVLREHKTIEKVWDGRSNSIKAFPTKSTLQPIFRKPPSLDDPLESRPEHEPLRARPLHRLRLEDFKLNPTHSEYAYHESIRKHDEKRAVGGCTDRHCHRCKDQRSFVENSGYQTLRKQGESADEADQRILEDSVGDDKRRLRKMSVEERMEMLWQAKTKEFADLHGKHRQAYTRARSPPGFWNVGMPSTQEEEENREASRLIEKEKLEGRYVEALRGGGRYVFADEVK